MKMMTIRGSIVKMLPFLTLSYLFLKVVSKDYSGFLSIVEVHGYYMLGMKAKRKCEIVCELFNGTSQ